MRIALLQMDIAWHAPERNLEKAGRMLSAASGAAIALLPEMFTSGFSMDAHKASEPAGGKSMRALSDAAKAHRMGIVAGLALLPAEGRPRNAALAYGPDGVLIAEYSKCHPFTLAGEDMHYEAGCAPVVFDIAGVKASVFICYDLRFPELFRRVADDVGIIFVLASWPASRKSHWRSLLIARAIENQCFVAGVNRIGVDGGGVAYAGGSIVVGPLGEIVAEATDAEEVLTAECDMREVERVRTEFPFLKDRRF